MKAIKIYNNKTCYTDNGTMPELTPFRNVLVKVFYAGVCRTDIGISKGIIAHKDGIVLGHEFCGVIDSFYNGDDSCDNWQKGMAVSCNPMLFGESDMKDEMCGKDVDGAFAEYIAVPGKALIGLSQHLLNPLGAFLEPVAAALAPIKYIRTRPQKSVCVFGNNRIAELTLQVAHCMGEKEVKLVKHIDKLTDNSYDCIIETEAQYIDKYIQALRPKGILILKSRAFQQSSIIPNEVAMKEITIQGARYGDFGAASHILYATSAGSCMLQTDALFGPIYELTDFERAFHEAQKTDSKKVFFRICAE